jgi:inositol oxygenase
MAKPSSSYRDYAAGAKPGVEELYRQNHAHQTLDFVRAKKREYAPLERARLGVWEAFDFLQRFADESDPDLDLSQLDHALQAAEAARADGRPRWFVLTAFIHDMGKMLAAFGEPQWAVVGDTFPVGCAFSEKVVYPELFEANPDRREARYSTPCGIYEEGCGLEALHLSWGHDEYLYQVLKDHLPPEALWIIRFHSFYAAHREGAYAHLLNEGDARILATVRAFNPYDLYSKSPDRPNHDQLLPYYRDLVAEFLPPVLRW